jgi:dTDP-4-dehydrorhamnose 3,5-epimerase
MMDLSPEISQPFRADGSFLRIGGKETMRMQLDVHGLAIPDVKLIRTPRFSDARGYFCETFQRADFAAQGLGNDFLQDNQSSSDRPGTVRGLHFQRPPFAQTKLVRVLHGSIFDVAVDLRWSSPSFGKHIGIKLSSKGNEQLFVPAGFAHGFCTIEPDTVVFYKVDQPYSAAHDGGINWADSQLGIEWPVASAEAILSDKDRALPILADLAPIFK